jgi:hypothetical protein
MDICNIFFSGNVSYRFITYKQIAEIFSIGFVYSVEIKKRLIIPGFLKNPGIIMGL